MCSRQAAKWACEWARLTINCLRLVIYRFCRNLLQCTLWLSSLEACSLLSSGDKLWFCVWLFLWFDQGTEGRNPNWCVRNFRSLVDDLCKWEKFRWDSEPQFPSLPSSFPPFLLPSSSIPLQKLVWEFAANLLTSDLRSHQRQPIGAENYPINSSKLRIYPFQLIPPWITLLAFIRSIAWKIHILAFFRSFQ